MALIPRLHTILEQSELTFEEVRAFEAGLVLLTKKQQEEFADVLEKDIGLIYPLYINYKAKLRAIKGTDEEWLKAVETEIVQLEDYLSKKRVGDEIK